VIGLQNVDECLRNYEELILELQLIMTARARQPCFGLNVVRSKTEKNVIKPTKYFCINLEKQNYNRKTISDGR